MRRSVPSTTQLNRHSVRRCSRRRSTAATEQHPRTTPQACCLIPAYLAAMTDSITALSRVVSRQDPDDESVQFATKPQQAKSMLERAVDAGVPFAWITGDEAHGQNRALRESCEEQDIHYVLATRKDHEVPSGLHTSTRVDELIAKVRAGAWRRLSCGDGAHGPRVYDWASVPTRAEFEHGRCGWVLARRSISTGELAYYVCFGPRGTRLRTLVATAGARWAVEESFQIAKNEAGLDPYQFRRYDAWCAHITLSMAAAAFLTIVRAAEAVKGEPATSEDASSLIWLTVNEIRRLFATLMLPRAAHDRTGVGLVQLPVTLPPTRPGRPLPQTARTPQKQRPAVAVLGEDRPVVGGCARLLARECRWRHRHGHGSDDHHATRNTMSIRRRGTQVAGRHAVGSVAIHQGQRSAAPGPAES